MFLAPLISFLTVGLTPALQSRWSINQNNTLIWEGQPYLPTGIRISGTVASVKAAADAGIKDVILDLAGDGRDWEPTVKAAEAAGIRYIIAPNSLTPTAPYYAIEPQSYRIAKITEPREVDITIPGAQSALCVFVTQRDSDIEKVERAAVVNGRLRLSLQPKNDLEHVLLIYPEVEDSQSVDYYEAFDRKRDELFASLRAAAPGIGLRGILNPIGKRSVYPDESSQSVPASTLFRAELEDYLRKKYTSVETCLKSWAMNAPTLDSFAEISRIIPLWSANRGISQMWDPQTDRLHACENKKSVAWDDIRAVKRQAAARRFDRLVISIQSATGVPVIQEWAGWNGPYSANRVTLGGLGMRLTDPDSRGAFVAAGSAAATALASTKPVWLVATDILNPSSNSVESLEKSLRTAADLGARGWFVRAGEDTSLAGKVAKIALQMSGDTAYAQWKPTALLFPEAAMNPAITKDLGGGKWWLPAPGGGSRLDLGNDLAGYRFSDGGTAYSALWSLRGERRVLLHLTENKFAKVEGLNGFDPKARIVKKGIEVTLGETPILVSGTSDAPVPDSSYKETLAMLERIMISIEKAGIESTEEKLEFRDSFNGFDRAPYHAYIALRRQLRRLSVVLGATIWLEGEVSRDHTFSEPIAAPGASGNSVLSLRPRIADPRNPFRAQFNFGVRVSGSHSVYVAGKFPPEIWKDVSLRIGDQAMTIQRGPEGLYGSGYGWYSLGKIELGTGQTKLILEIRPSCSTDLDLDAIVLSPGSFVPDGVRTPEIKFDNRGGS